MNTHHDRIESGNTRSAERPTYSAPRLQRLGRVSELTQLNSSPNPTFFDGSAYTS
ncbi:lasso RiPP family leader peptide-containing protein [Brevundimonas sp.]|uniref:lasso RiPP family leader peptide-containing protein n=1 Tax=Brevundimonas sp. TaxID=1871086 RepID=UPI0034DFDD28